VKYALAGLLLALAATAQAGVQVFEQAERTYGDWPGSVPGRYYTWTPVTLPQNFWKSGLVTGARNWYRMQFHYEPTSRSQSIYFPKLRLYSMDVYVNDRPIWRSLELYAPGVNVNALRITIPKDLLRAGQNTVHIEAVGSSRWFNSLSRVYVGDTVELARRAAVRALLQEYAIYVIAVAFGAIGLISLCMWPVANRDPVLFWYGISGLAVLIATAVWYFTLTLFDAGAWRVGLIFIRYHGYLVPIFILHLRLAERRLPWLEGILWITLIWAYFSISAYGWDGARAWFWWSLIFSVLPAMLVVPLLRSPQLRIRPAVQLLIVADIAACLFPLHDWAWRLGLLDNDRIYLVYYAPAFVMLAAAAPIIQRAQASIRATERGKLELERRVAEKSREIEASHEELRRAQRDAALAEERRRIMADMHDGLGARLVALLSVAQSGKAKHGEITEGLAAALDELRLAIDSVQPVEGDVGVVLGNVRHRMRSVFERSGIKLNWNVSELPRMEDLTPERILAIQRIFLEAFSNAIRHSGARTVSVFTTRVPGAVRIVIEDDGRGFDADAPHAGTGLHNLQLRAVQAGGTLQVESKAGKGTRLTLSLPLGGDAPPEPLPNTGQKPEDYPVIGIPANATSS
jgi:signal transduction histidine kinase